MSKERKGTEKKEIVTVFSLDFDGCVFNGNFYNKLENEKVPLSSALLDGNQLLLDDIKEKRKGAEILLVGSNRQSYGMDQSNTRGDKKIAGSCFTAIKELSEKLEMPLDTFLMADLYYEVESGTSFNAAIQQLNNPSFKSITHNECLEDKNKLTLLYAQIHKIACEHPQETVVFNFYDDREDILGSLNTFFTQNPSFIPENVNLQLNKYDGTAPPSKIAKIQGSGFIDYHYGDTVIEMSSYILASQGIDDFKIHHRDRKFISSQGINAARDLNNNMIKDILKNRVNRKLIDDAKNETFHIDPSASAKERLLYHYLGFPRYNEKQKYPRIAYALDWIAYAAGGFILAPLQTLARTLEYGLYVAEIKMNDSQLIKACRVTLRAFISPVDSFVYAKNFKSSWRWPAMIASGLVLLGYFAAMILAPPASIIQIGAGIKGFVAGAKATKAAISAAKASKAAKAGASAVQTSSVAIGSSLSSSHIIGTTVKGADALTSATSLVIKKSLGFKPEVPTIEPVVPAQETEANPTPDPGKPAQKTEANPAPDIPNLSQSLNATMFSLPAARVAKIDPTPTSFNDDAAGGGVVLVPFSLAPS